MIVNDVLIEKLARLSRLELNAEEKPLMKNELQKMIAFIEKLNELDTQGIEPLLHMSHHKGVFRNDKVQGQLSKEEVFKNALRHSNGFFEVPKVVKNPSAAEIENSINE